jgi:hypothetical protein
MGIRLTFTWTSRLAIGLLACFSTVDAISADCLRDTREIEIKGDSGTSGVRLRHYLCDQPGIGQVSVQFNRLNDLATSLLISGRAPEISREFQGTKLVRNAVLEEYIRLLAAFGTTESGGGASLLATSPTGDSGTAEVESTKDERVMVAAQGDARPMDFPDAAALSSLINHTTVPPRYTVAKSNNDYSALIWRYMTQDDLSQYGVLVQQYNKVVLTKKFEIQENPGDPPQRQFSGFSTSTIPNYIRLYRHLAQGGLPADFITISGERDLGPQCGYRKFWEFNYQPRELVVDFAFIHNRSSKPLTISGLLGSTIVGQSLRTPSTGLPGANERQNVTFSQPARIAPNERIAVPIRLTWIVNDSFRTQFSAEKKSPPSANPYSWGPEIRVAGVQLENQTLTLEGGAANYLAVTTSCECGSCPHLYAWDRRRREWANTGKIIDKAKGEDLQMSETRAFTGLVTMFKLVEHEAELAKIDQVNLEIELVSGKKIRLMPKLKQLHNSDQSYIDLAMGDALEMRFQLPDSIAVSKVRTSRLTVTGYYDRFTDILAKQLGNPLPLASGFSDLLIGTAKVAAAGDVCVRPIP